MPRSSISQEKFAEIETYSDMKEFYNIITGNEDQIFNGIVKIVNLYENKIIEVVNPKFTGPVNWARRLPYVKMRDSDGKKYVVSVPEKNKLQTHLFFYQKNTSIRGGRTARRIPKLNRTTRRKIN
jgi:hypothetical protein